MSICKDCIHFVACVDFWFSDYDVFYDIELSRKKHANNKACTHFKPTADVVEVVRCKECKHFDHGICVHEFACSLIRDDDFCSYGERSENGT